MFYIELDGNIVLFSESREEITNTVNRYTPQYQGLEIKETDRPIVDFQFADTIEYDMEKDKKEKERIAMLKMTPLDFLKAIQSLGVSYQQIKALCDANDQVDMELRFCNHVYRGNPLLDQLASQFGVTSAQLDTLFETYGT